MGFTRYREEKARQEQSHLPEVQKQARKEKTEKPRAGGKRNPVARRQLTICEREIAKAETELAELEQKMEQNACDYGKYNAFYQEKQQLEQQLEQMMQRWEELSVLAEQDE